MNIFVMLSWLVVLLVLTTAQDEMRNLRYRQLEISGNSRFGEISGSKNTPSIILNLIVVPVVHDGNKEEKRQPPLKQQNWQWPEPEYEILTHQRDNRLPLRMPRPGNDGPAEGVLPTSGCPTGHINDIRLGCIRRGATGNTTRRPRRSAK